MSRLPLLTPSDLSADQTSLYDSIVGGPRGGSGGGRGLTTPEGALVGPFNAWLFSPAIGSRISQLGEAVRFSSSLPQPVIEVAILVMARHWRAQFEGWAHERIARRAGVEDPVIEAIRNQRRPESASPQELLVYDFATELLAERRISDSLWEKARQSLGEAGVVELVALLGYYSLISMMLNTFSIPVPKGQKAPYRE